MKISQARKRYLFTTKIELPKEADETIADYVVLRELTVQEMQQFSQEKEKENIKLLEKLFSDCMVEHSFVEDDETPTPNQEVYNFLKESGTLFTEMLDIWFNSIPFKSRIRKPGDSDK
jgi:outer membrane protein assembly factor BamA